MEDQNDDIFIKDRLNQLYLSIIMRYRNYIEERENLSVAELPSLITPNSDLVTKKAEELKGNNYTYELGFYEASTKALQFIKNEIDEVLLPVQFWILPDETIKFKLGDPIDKNILLCSLIIHLGNPSSKVIIIINETSRKAYVHYEFNEGIYLFNVNGSIKLFQKKEDMINYLDINENTSAYEFNDKMFVDIS